MLEIPFIVSCTFMLDEWIEQLNMYKIEIRHDIASDLASLFSCSHFALTGITVLRVLGFL